MTDNNLVSIDLAKSVFQLCQFTDDNRIASNRKVSRTKLSRVAAQLPPSTVVMEACYSAHYWGRLFQHYGHTVKLVPAQHVKPFVRGNKNDANDAIAIAEASLRPNMRFVQVKSLEQQDIQSLHKIRERYVSHRTRIGNQTRGLLSEYGLVARPGFKALKELIHEALDSEGLTWLFKEELSSIYQELVDLEKGLRRVNGKLKAVAEQCQCCRLLMTIPGIGVINATAIYAAIGDGKQFATARDFAVWMGLTPQHYASGTKSFTGTITKRGNRYLRKQLVHGARALMHRSNRKTDRLSVWVTAIENRRGSAKANVALAHKLARICWAVLSRGEEFKLHTVAA